jgi:hypothetical protein
MRAVETGLAGVVVEVVVGGEEDRRDEGEGDCEGARRRRRRSVASEGVRTGRVDQDAAVESEVVERAGEEAVKVAARLWRWLVCCCLSSLVPLSPWPLRQLVLEARLVRVFR